MKFQNSFAPMQQDTNQKGTTNPLHLHQVRDKSNNLLFMLAFCSECSVLKMQLRSRNECSMYIIYKFMPPINLNSMGTLQKKKAMCT